MKLYALDIPDDPAGLPGWLESHLVGPDLGSLVAELSAVHGDANAGTSGLDEVLGGRTPDVLCDGLAALPAATLRQLLVRPALLLELQERVLAGGGAHWDQVTPSSADGRPAVENGRQRLAHFLTEQRPPSWRGDPSPIIPARPRPAWYRHPAIVSLATAAAIFGVLAVLYRTRPPVEDHPEVAVQPPSAWGWNRPDALPQNEPAARYLTELADAAGEWFNKRPETPAELSHRILQFRQGCSVLLLASHKPLADADRRWLIRRCRVWASQLDQELVRLEAGGKVDQVRAEADDTVRRLIQALRDRARAVAEG